MQFCRLRCSVFWAFPSSLVTVVCLKLVLVWPVGKEWIAESGIYSEPFAFQVLRAGSLVYFKSGENVGPRLPCDWTSVLLLRVGWNLTLSQWLSPGLIGEGSLLSPNRAPYLPCWNAANLPRELSLSGLTCTQLPHCKSGISKLSLTVSTHCHLTSSLGLPGISSSRVTLEQETG